MSVTHTEQLDTEGTSPSNSGVLRRRAMVAASFCAVTLAILLPVPAQLRLPVIPQDEGMVLVYPWLLLHGAVPNHSFESVYGPTWIWMMAGAYRLFNASIVVERLVGIAYRFLFVGALATLAGRRRGLLGSVMAAGLAAPLLTALGGSAWEGGLAFAASGFAVLEAAYFAHSHRTRQAAFYGIAGVLLAVGGGFRPDLGIPELLALVILRPRSRLSWITIVAGLIVGGIPVWSNLANAGLTAVVRGEFIQPVFVSEKGRHLPLLSASPAALLLLSASILVVVLQLGLTIIHLYRYRTSLARTASLALGFFELGLVPESLQRTDAPHVLGVACFVIPAALCLPLAKMDHGIWRSRSAVLTLGTAACALLALAPLCAHTYGSLALRSLGLRPQRTFKVQVHGRTLLVSTAASASALRSALRAVQLNSKRGSRIFVGPRDLRFANYTYTSAYFLLPNLTPCSFYLEMDPGVANAANSGLSKRLPTCNILLLTSQYSNWNEPNASRVPGSETPNLVVLHDFRQTGAWGPWSVWVKRTSVS